MTDSVLSQVCRIAADTFEVSEELVGPESSPESLVNWDSIQHLNFILALEARFNIELSAEEMENIRSISDAVKVVEGRNGGA
jgi:acyl carrier protein